MKKYLVLVCIVAFAYSSGKTQTNIGVVGFDYNNNPSGYEDTVTANSTDTYSVWVKNFGPLVFNDSLTLITAVWDSVNLNIYPVSSYSTLGAVQIGVNDSIAIPLTAVYNLSSNGYRLWIDVIVIWPIANPATTVDSLEFPVYVIPANGINEIDLKQLIKAYPNPVSSNLAIENNSKMDIEEVRIFDSSGRLLITEKNKSIINTERWQPGIYTIKFLLNNKQHHSIRVIKQ
jgi:hypothetical protein